LKLYEYARLNPLDYADVVLHRFITDREIVSTMMDIPYKLVLSKCNIIAISGDSGSGKTTLMNHLRNLYEPDSVTLFETDRYHKWERGDENYTKFTHLNPRSNHLELMKEDVYNLKIGNNIMQVDYDHNTGKFTKKQEIQCKDNMILCGLHTLYDDRLNEIIDLKIFMDTDRELIKKWKIERDTKKRGYTEERIRKQIEDREGDYFEYIDNQKNNADIVIRQEERHTFFIIQNTKIAAKLLPYFLCHGYTSIRALGDGVYEVLLKSGVYVYEEIYSVLFFFVFESI
jgi:uridine kinase